MSMSMDRINSIAPVSPEVTQSPGAQGIKGDTGFKELLKTKVEPGNSIDSAGAALRQPLGKVLPELKFSSHALDRIRSRGISFQDGDLERLKSAVDKAEKKGAKETLILMGDNALIVNVKNKTVVTAMDRAQLKENVFTNIDSTVVL